MTGVQTCALPICFGVAKFASPAIDAWSDGKELVFGFIIVAIIAGSYFLAIRMVRRPQLAT